MARPIVDLLGQIFGNLTVVEFCEIRSGHAYWNIRCTLCGSIKAMQAPNLKKRKSCGCEGGSKKHGLHKHPLYGTWQNMMTRCYNNKSTDYPDYGGRGITVCERWHDIRNFIEDMGPKPDGFQIDREKNELGYSKENCRWVTKVENARNKRSTVFVDYNGHSMPLSKAAELSGVPYATLAARVRNGKNPDIFRK